MTTGGKTIQIFADSRGRGICKGCGAPIEWAKLVASGKKMPFDVPIVEVSGHQDLAGREVHVVSLERNHWASCSARAQFKRK